MSKAIALEIARKKFGSDPAKWPQFTCVGCDRTTPFKHGVKLPEGFLCPGCVSQVKEQQPCRRCT